MTITGIEMFTDASGVRHYSYVTKGTKKGEGRPASVTVASLTEIPKENLLTPVVVVLTGKGILHKKLTPDPAQPNYLNRIFPNAKPGEFVLQITPTADGNEIISVIRQDLLDSFLKDLNASGIKEIHSLHLGPFVLNNYPDVALKERTVQTHAGTVTFHEGRIIDFAAESGSLNENNPIPLAAAVTGLTDQECGIKDHLALQEMKTEFLYRQRFSKAGKMVIAALFIIFISNFLVFDHYRNEVNQLHPVAEKADLNLQRIAQLEDAMKERSMLMSNGGFGNRAKGSYFADQLAESLPASVSWTELNLNPEKKKQPGEEEFIPQYNSTEIQIRGACRKSIDLNNWLKKLNTFYWISQAKLINYEQKTSGESGVFLISVMLK